MSTLKIHRILGKGNKDRSKPEEETIAALPRHSFPELLEGDLQLHPRAVLLRILYLNEDQHP